MIQGFESVVVDHIGLDQLRDPVVFLRRQVTGRAYARRNQAGYCAVIGREFSPDKYLSVQRTD